MHEWYEYNLMKKDVPYWEAHKEANKVEKKARLKAMRRGG